MPHLPEELRIRLLALDLVGFMTIEPAPAGNADAASRIDRIAVAKNGLGKVGATKRGQAKVA